MWRHPTSLLFGRRCIPFGKFDPDMEHHFFDGTNIPKTDFTIVKIIDTYTHVSIYIYMYTTVYICMYTYVLIRVYIYIFIDTYSDYMYA